MLENHLNNYFAYNSNNYIGNHNTNCSNHWFVPFMGA